MDQLYKFVKNFFFLTPVKTVIIAIPSYLFVIFVLVNNIQNEAISNLAYILSAYALIITITGIIRIVQFVHQSKEMHPLLKKVVSIPIIGRLIKENTFRTQIALYPGFLINVVYVIWKLSFGIYYKSAWFISLALYYFVLAWMRLSLIRPFSVKEGEIRKKAELKRYRICGASLLVINIALSGIVVLAVKKENGFTYPGYMIYVMAMYAFYSVITAVINLVKYRKYGSPVLSAAKVISLTTAMVSMFSLESAMLAQFSDASQTAFKKIMTECTGGVICAIVIEMAVYMMFRSTKEIRKI